MKRHPREPATLTLNKHLASDIGQSNLQLRSALERSHVLRTRIKFLPALGVRVVTVGGFKIYFLTLCPVANY